MEEERVRQIANEIFKETLKKDLDSSLIFTYINNLEKDNKIFKHRLDIANNYIESRIENMLSEHYDDLKYILNECDLDSTW